MSILKSSFLLMLATAATLRGSPVSATAESAHLKFVINGCSSEYYLITISGGRNGNGNLHTEFRDRKTVTDPIVASEGHLMGSVSSGECRANFDTFVFRGMQRTLNVYLHRVILPRGTENIDTYVIQSGAIGGTLPEVGLWVKLYRGKGQQICPVMEGADFYFDHLGPGQYTLRVAGENWWVDRHVLVTGNDDLHFMDLKRLPATGTKTNADKPL